jgi:hypothetical protein
VQVHCGRTAMDDEQAEERDHPRSWHHGGSSPPKLEPAGVAAPGRRSRNQGSPMGSGPGGIRTLTPLPGPRILSPLRLPVPPQARGCDHCTAVHNRRDDGGPRLPRAAKGRVSRALPKALPPVGRFIGCHGPAVVYC